MPRQDGRAPASERILSPRRFITRADANTALDVAAELMHWGMPVGLARPAFSRRTGQWDPTWGTGGSGFWVSEGWEHTRLDFSILDRYQYGDALFAVTGHTLDVLDIDPRNGGDRDLAEIEHLGLIPSVYAGAVTPSGGEHRFLGHLGVRKTKRGGLDLQAGDDDGKGRGFVWIAPTVRRSKVDGVIRPYRWTQAPEPAMMLPAGESALGLLDWFKATEPATSRADEQHWNGDTDTWLAQHTTGQTLSHAVARAVQPFIEGEPFAGHDRMVRFQVHLVRLAAEGHNGIPEALAYARTVWLATPHASDEDPAQEWDVALDRAIYKYGGS